MGEALQSRSDPRSTLQKQIVVARLHPGPLCCLPHHFITQIASFLFNPHPKRELTFNWQPKGDVQNLPEKAKRGPGKTDASSFRESEASRHGQICSTKPCPCISVGGPDPLSTNRLASSLLNFMGIWGHPLGLSVFRKTPLWALKGNQHESRSHVEGFPEKDIY